MDDFKTLDARFAACIDLEVGSCISVAVGDFVAALNTTDTNAAIQTFKNWAESHYLLADQLNPFSMMVGRCQ